MSANSDLVPVVATLRIRWWTRAVAFGVLASVAIVMSAASKFAERVDAKGTARVQPASAAVNSTTTVISS